MDNGREALEILGKGTGNILWKRGEDPGGFPREIEGGQFSTGDVGKYLLILWKTWRKMWKDGEIMQRYLVALIFVIMALTVSANFVSLFMRFSTLVTPLRVVEWSRPPKSLPVSSRDRLVMRRMRYMAI